MSVRLEVRQQVLECTACSLHERCTAPVPFTGPTPATLTVVGEAPGTEEDVAGEPFVGPAGKLLRGLLQEVGFDPEATFICNTVSCLPTDYKKRPRTPSRTEILQCSGNLKAQMELAGSPTVALLGGVALGTHRRDLKITKVRGTPLLLSPEAVAIPTFHPSYVLRMGGAGSPCWKQVLEDLTLLKKFADTPGSEWINLLPDTCFLCGEPAEKFDEDALPWCLECNGNDKG